MIDIKELRKVIADCYWPTSPVAINEILDRLEAAEKDVTLKERVIDALGSELNAVAKERDALRAKIEQMEKQEPVAWTTKLALEYGSSRLGFQVSDVNMWGENGAPLYVLPGAQPQLNEIRTALQRALELGRREAWTGVRKHRSWEDQREEQQCWDKVWSLLGAKGESE